MENTELLDDCDLQNFSDFFETSSESECCIENIISNEGNNITANKAVELVQMQIKSKFSNKATTNIVKFMNEMPNAAITLPNNKNAIQRLISQKIDHKFLITCDKCSELVEDGGTCEKCDRVMTKNSKKNNFIVYFPLEPQIRLILNQNFEAIIGFLNRKHANDVLSDIDDGMLYQKMSAENPHIYILTFTVNLDGANIFKSSRDSLWPVQLYLNFLPPEIRYLPENIIISSLYYGRKKPNMVDMLYPLAAEMDFLTNQPISVYCKNEFWNFRPVMLLCSCDLPARAEVQSLKGPTGHYGCSYCYHPGLPILNNAGKTTTRFVKQASASQLRMHEETVLLAQRVSAKDFGEEEKDSNKGVKGHSAMLMFDNIDIINSFPIDYMHGIPLGIMKNLMEIWLGMKRIPKPPYLHYKIKTTENRKMLEKRILSLRPTLNFHRKPRSIFEIGHYKASELQNLMWFYLRYSLNGLLPTRVVKHFEKLSAATFILSQKEVKKTDVKVACDILISFANEFEEIYGQGAISMNLHLLRHYHNMILNCGPLWSYNLFGYENNIGELKKYVCGTTDVLMQITRKYVISRSSPQKLILSQKDNSKYIDASQPKTITINQEYVEVLQNSGMIASGQTTIKIWRRIKIKGQTYTSTNAVETKSADYFVRVSGNRIGKIEFYFGNNSAPSFLLKLYEITFENFHWNEIQSLNSFEICSCNEIEEKLLYLKVESLEYVTKEPHTYGRVCL